MDIKEFIASGIIEGYVMSWATEEEILKVEALALIHPEIKEEIQHIQNSLADFALKNGKTPPSHLKETIWAKINGTEKKVININTPIDAKKAIGIPTYLSAAAIILFIISFGINIVLIQKYNSKNAEVQALNAEKEILATQFKMEQASLIHEKSKFALIMKSTTKVVPMKGLPIAPEALATIYWDTATTEVFLNVNRLPSIPSEKQYQLWAIVEGKPVDAGVFDGTLVSALQKMNSFDHPQAFAVTLENKGGSVSPTMEAMYVMGQI